MPWAKGIVCSNNHVKNTRISSVERLLSHCTTSIAITIAIVITAVSVALQSAFDLAAMPADSVLSPTPKVYCPSPVLAQSSLPYVLTPCRERKESMDYIIHNLFIYKHNYTIAKGT